MAKMRLYKIKFDSHIGKGLYFCTEATNIAKAKANFYRYMPTTDKPKSKPVHTTKHFIGSQYQTNPGKEYWIVKPIKTK